MSDKVKCPECGSDKFFYVCRSVEYHKMDSLPDEDGYTDLCELIDSNNDDSFDPYLTCFNCNSNFDIKMKKIIDVKE